MIQCQTITKNQNIRSVQKSLCINSKVHQNFQYNIRSYSKTSQLWTKAIPTSIARGKNRSIFKWRWKPKNNQLSHITIIFNKFPIYLLLVQNQNITTTNIQPNHKLWKKTNNELQLLTSQNHCYRKIVHKSLNLSNCVTIGLSISSLFFLFTHLVLLCVNFNKVI